MSTFARIYAATAIIPKGKVATYAQLAKITGVNNPRIVGFALHSNKNPEKIPCHRVVKSTGQLAYGYAFGGVQKQKEKLQKEGVRFLDNDSLDLDRYLFQPEEKMLQRLTAFFKT